MIRLVSCGIAGHSWQPLAWRWRNGELAAVWRCARCGGEHPLPVGQEYPPAYWYGLPQPARRAEVIRGD